MNMLTKDDVQKIVDGELVRMSPERKLLIASYLVEPEVELRVWEYGEGMDEIQYPCWTVARYSPHRGVAYSQYGFGASEYGRPWGLIDFSEDCYSQDGLWETSLDRLVKQFSPLKYR